LLQKANDAVDTAYERQRIGFERAYQFVREGRQKSPPSPEKLDEAGRLYAGAVAETSNLEDVIGKQLHSLVTARKGLSAQEANEADRAVADATNAIESVTRGLTGGADILDDPRAAEVLYAPDERWKRAINTTLCKGRLGNTDCAVKMEGIGSFTIKGVRLDATKITQATFAIANQALQVVAAATGAPRPGGDSGSGGATSGGSTMPDVAAARSRQRQAQAALLQLRLSRLAILDAVAGERRALAGDQTERDAAVQRLKQTLGAYNATSASGGGS